MTITNNLADHTRKLYEGLMEASKEETVNDATYNVFRGSMTDIYSNLGISRSYYSRIVGYLAENGCITYLQKGGRSIESVIVLHHAPSFEGIDLSPLTGRGRHDKLEARLKVVEDRLGGLDYPRIMVEFERRLKKLEGKAYGKETQG